MIEEVTLASLAERVAQLERVWGLLAQAEARAARAEEVLRHHAEYHRLPELTDTPPCCAALTPTEERCPTCGSDDRAILRRSCAANANDEVPPDPWHALTPTEEPEHGA